MWQRHEERFIQKLVSQPPIEVFDEGALDRFTWRDVVTLDFNPVRPLQDRVAGEFAPVFTDDHLRLATLLDDPIQLTSNPKARERCIGDKAQAFPGAIIDDR
ncbi:hypothetical protein A3843_03760 [Pseudovibrio exalbescens]|uniref:Uncharacterized protein n=1 Tax=Pseudovibrio exalbescens TaxID=197461 RepID=A0A1U7JL52_9HYPH|nr:hypothetical protein A3843_03760 [Pseudovibrio exalbescens]